MSTITTPVDFATKKVSPGRLLAGLESLPFGGEDAVSADHYTSVHAYLGALAHLATLTGGAVDPNWLSIIQPAEGLFRFQGKRGDYDPTNLAGTLSLNQGTIQFTAQPLDGELVTIDAGPNDGSHIFEFDMSADGIATSSDVDVTGGATVEASMQALVDAINANIGNDCRAYYIAKDDASPLCLILANILGVGDTNTITTDVTGAAVSGMT